MTMKISRKSSSGWLQPVFHFGPENGEEHLKTLIDINSSSNWREQWTWPTRRQSQRQRHADRHKDFDDFVDTDKDKDIGNDLVIQWLSYTVDYFWQIEKLRVFKCSSPFSEPKWKKCSTNKEPFPLKFSWKSVSDWLQQFFILVLKITLHDLPLDCLTNWDISCIAHWLNEGDSLNQKFIYLCVLLCR